MDQAGTTTSQLGKSHCLVKNFREPTRAGGGVFLGACRLASDYLVALCDDPQGACANFVPPDQLRAQIDLSIGEAPLASPRQLLPILESYLRFMPKTNHVAFANQLYGGTTVAGVVGELFAAVTNTSMSTYEISPVSTLMELELIHKLAAAIGWRECPTVDGIMCSGGSNANFLGMLCARQQAQPQCKESGLSGTTPLSAFVSDQAHYSFEKAALQLGLGIRAIYKVKSDDYGRMRADALEEAVQQSEKKGERPFFVCATAGTTVLGAFDPVPAIAEVANRHRLWLHVDGAWGAPVLLSGKHRTLLAGSELADSVTWDFHKFMSVPAIATMFVTRHGEVLHDGCSLQSQSVNYLLHQDNADAARYDLGRKSLACGRRVDSLKTWLTWKLLGDRGYAAAVERAMELAQTLALMVTAEPTLELLEQPAYLNVCFRARCPPGCDDANAFTLRLRDRLVRGGRHLVNYGYVRCGSVAALRYVCTNFALRDADLRAFLNEVLDAARATQAAAL
eukprot:TRINITY_DN3860_c0_g1_i1.p1 TRINITY_DN3860_c0_g1~~TRINITY_DN3860_c0_g1_i1.p1  ORF type:complete len:508 (-),score=117.99 TRINITY_DN3860_c0_g1_i1:145-1668(-)